MSLVALSFKQKPQGVANVRLVIGKEYAMGVIRIWFHSERKGKPFLESSP